MDVIDFLKDVINIPSLSGKEDEVAKRVKEELIKLGYDEIIEKRGNVCGRIGSGPLVILYDAHMDVVEPGQGWKGEPFKARVDNGFLYGRGACDDKSSLAAIIYGGIKSQVEGITLYVLASVREEVAAGNGLKEFLELSGIKPDYVVIAEPSSLRIARGNRGRIGVRIGTKGKTAHASSPSLGENAIYKSVDIIKNIKDLNDAMEEDTVAVTKVETSNENINVIPENCSIYCDYRSSAGRKESDILNRLKSCIRDKGSIVSSTQYYKPWDLDSESLLIKTADKCLSEKIGKKEIIIWDFCTNGSFTAGELGIPTVGFGPGVEREAHSAEEKIEIDSVLKAVDLYSAFPKYLLEALGKND
jgi:putative selenium metabolism hydrolase